jgi:hypothetical protein
LRQKLKAGAKLEDFAVEKSATARSVSRKKSKKRRKVKRQVKRRAASKKRAEPASVETSA